MRQDLRQEWKEDELRLAVLQVLLGARKMKPASGGASASELVDCLKVRVDQMLELLQYLSANSLVQGTEDHFMITANGVDYVDEHSPDCTPPNFFTELDAPPPSSPGQEPPPWSPSDGPGPWPPGRNPDDPSKVPRKGKPSAGAGEIALPLPDTEQLNESQP
jgi:hypothetical protein